MKPYTFLFQTDRSIEKRFLHWLGEIKNKKIYFKKNETCSYVHEFEKKKVCSLVVSADVKITEITSFIDQLEVSWLDEIKAKKLTFQHGTFSIVGLTI